jgi:FlaA1/EpsC-like NDP-sugar epimerase
VLVCGAGDAGEMAVRWMLMNPEMGYRPVGFLDSDPYKAGRAIHGVEIIGTLEQLGGILEARAIDGIILTGDVLEDTKTRGELIGICQASGRWVRTLRLEFERLER